MHVSDDKYIETIYIDAIKKKKGEINIVRSLTYNNYTQNIENVHLKRRIETSLAKKTRGGCIIVLSGSSKFNIFYDMKH